MTPLTLDHLIFAVQELPQAAAGWARTFGLEAESPYHPERSHLELARLPLSDDRQGGAFLELVADVGRGEPALSDAEALARLPRSRRVARFIAERGEGMFSLSLQVDDLAAAVRDLRAKGVPVSDPEPGAWPGTRLARIPRAAAFGVAIQLIERRSPAQLRR